MRSSPTCAVASGARRSARARSRRSSRACGSSRRDCRPDRPSSARTATARRPSPDSSRSTPSSRTSTSRASPATSARRSTFPQRRPDAMRSAFWSIAWFDFARRLKATSTWIYLVLYAVLAGLWMAGAGGALSSVAVSFGGDKILINGPYALTVAIGILGFVGITVIGSVSGRAVQQDFEAGIHQFFFSAPITKRDYFFG